eukprot:469762-Pyramimonas_sp.AAC.1
MSPIGSFGICLIPIDSNLFLLILPRSTSDFLVSSPGLQTCPGIIKALQKHIQIIGNPPGQLGIPGNHEASSGILNNLDNTA